MTENPYHVTQPERPFARANRQTIQQRAQILQELGYKQLSIAKICCGDCQRQQQIYQEILQTETYRGLDMSPTVVALNRANGVDCVQGDALDSRVMRPFASFDVLFFGPPLSEQCDGHTGLSFEAVRPGFAPFVRLLTDITYLFPLHDTLLLKPLRIKLFQHLPHTRHQTQFRAIHRLPKCKHHLCTRLIRFPITWL